MSSVQEKVRCKTLSKCWKDAAIVALSRHECLSFGEKDGYIYYMPHRIKCWGKESHTFDEEFQLNIKVMDSYQLRRKFFSEFRCLKVIIFPPDRKFTRVWKYYLTKGPHQHLECLQIYHLELLVNLPNLRHLSCKGLTVEALNSIINNSPHLTQLTIDVNRVAGQKNKSIENFSDVLGRLPLGLEYLKMKCSDTDVFAVLSSPAMKTIKCLYFDGDPCSATTSFDKLECCASPTLEIFGINGIFRFNHKCSNTLLDYLRTAKNMKKVELDTTWLFIKDRITLLKSWSHMTIIKLRSIFEETGMDELINVILTNNRDTLNALYLYVVGSLNRDSWEKLGNFPVLKRLICLDRQVSVIIFEKQRLI